MNEELHWTRYPAAIVTAVVVLHVGALAALQSGLLVRAYELMVPVEMISQIIEPPKPEVSPPPRPPTPIPAQLTQAVLPLAPQPIAVSDPTPAPNAPVVTPAPSAALPPIAAIMAAAPVPAPATLPAATPAPAPKLELPRSDADYLNNPAPPYPPVSRRMGEQGRVLVRVCVDEKGQPQKAELSKSSSYERLDSAAVATVMRWRFKPGTRNGVPEAGCVGVPVDFKLD